MRERIRELKAEIRQLADRILEIEQTKTGPGETRDALIEELDGLTVKRNRLIAEHRQLMQSIGYNPMILTNDYRSIEERQRDIEEANAVKQAQTIRELQSLGVPRFTYTENKTYSRRRA